MLVLDAATGRVVRSYHSDDDPIGLDWLGGDGLDVAGSRRELLVGVYGDSYGDPDLAYEVVDRKIGGNTFEGGRRTAAPRQGFVLQHSGPKEFVFVGSDEVFRGGAIEIQVPRMPEGVPFRVVADVAHDR